MPKPIFRDYYKNLSSERSKLLKKKERTADQSLIHQDRELIVPMVINVVVANLGNIAKSARVLGVSYYHLKKFISDNEVCSSAIDMIKNDIASQVLDMYQDAILTGEISYLLTDPETGEKQVEVAALEPVDRMIHAEKILHILKRHIGEEDRSKLTIEKTVTNNKTVRVVNSSEVDKMKLLELLMEDVPYEDIIDNGSQKDNPN